MSATRYGFVSLVQSSFTYLWKEKRINDIRRTKVFGHRAKSERNVLKFCSDSSKVSPSDSKRNHVDCSVQQEVPQYVKSIKHCSRCGSKAEWKIPACDNRFRAVCTSCLTIFYVNPKVVVGAVCLTKDRSSVVLCKRAIPPAVGKWTIPAGFMEMEESSLQGASRETLEETGASVEIGQLLAVYNIVSAGQVHLIFRAELSKEQHFAPGSETLAVDLFSWNNIPWNDLAFATTHWALQYARTTLKQEIFVPDMVTKP